MSEESKCPSEVMEVPKAEDLLSNTSYKSIEVHKSVELDLDVGNLLATDSNMIDKSNFLAMTEKVLLDLARDNTQLLINSIWDLPNKRVEDVVVAVLPAGKTILPREKPVPKVKPPTKWEKYARDKGIQKRKKDKLTWDEELKKWVPRYGYRKAQAEKEKNWLVEVPDNAPYDEDMLKKISDKKKERIAKNEVQRLRNIMKRKKSDVPTAGILSVDNPKSDQIASAVFDVRKSTASVGKFTSLLPKEKKLREKGKKRKFDSLFSNANAEKSKNMKIVESILSKRNVLDLEKAVNKQVMTEEQSAGNEKRARSQSKRPKAKRTGKKTRPSKFNK